MIGSRVHRKTGVKLYFIRFRTLDGLQIQETVGPSWKEAKKLLEKRRVEVQERRYVNPRTVEEVPEEQTVTEFVADFMERIASRTRSDHYAVRLKPVLAEWGTKRLSEVTRADVDAYMAKRTAAVSPSTARKDCSVVRKLFTTAEEWGLIDRSPARGVKGPSEPKPETRYLSVEEVTRLEATCPAWLRRMVSFAVATGMRLKEITSLQWEDWDRNAGNVHVDQDTKTGARVVPVSEAARRVLEAAWTRRKDSMVLRRSPFIFVTDSGNDYNGEESRRRISRRASAAMRAAGITGATFHSLRHTAASLMVQRGVPLYQVGQVLGHSTPLMTQRYAHLEPGHLRAAVAQLDAALGVVSGPVVVTKAMTCPEPMDAAPTSAAS